MRVHRTIADFRAEIAPWRRAGERIGLVTTMGALHAGHLSLVEAARAENDRVVTTIFVNPTQFGEAKDLETYPRTETEDLEKFDAAGVDAVLIPEVGEIYPEGSDTMVETPTLANAFHGRVRPGHFRGVATVVAKLLNIAQADAAYFGEKDYQQLAVIRRMATDLHFPTRIEGVPTMREEDGLAMSSRNARLRPEDRKAAPILNAALDTAETLARAGTTVEEMAEVIARVVATEPRARLKGLDIVNPASFTEVSGDIIAPVGIMISAEFGPPDDPILLIDQREVRP